jgi:hypothetical protein
MQGREFNPLHHGKKRGKETECHIFLLPFGHIQKTQEKTSKHFQKQPPNTYKTLQTLLGEQLPGYSQPWRNGSYFLFSRLKGLEKGIREITPLMVCLPEGKALFPSLVLTSRNSRLCVHSKVITLWLWIPTGLKWPWGGF